MHESRLSIQAAGWWSNCDLTLPGAARPACPLELRCHHHRLGAERTGGGNHAGAGGAFGRRPRSGTDTRRRGAVGGTDVARLPSRCLLGDPPARRRLGVLPLGPARGARSRMDSPARSTGSPARRWGGGNPGALRRDDGSGARAGQCCVSAPDGPAGALGRRAYGRTARPTAPATASAADVALWAEGDPLGARAGRRLVQGPARARALCRHRRSLDPAAGEDADIRGRTDAWHRRPRCRLAAAAWRIPEDHRCPGVVSALAGWGGRDRLARRDAGGAAAGKGTALRRVAAEPGPDLRTPSTGPLSPAP